MRAEVVLDITDLTDANGEQGLLGLAFHPTADLAYVNYIDDVRQHRRRRVRRRSVDRTVRSGVVPARSSRSTSRTRTTTAASSRSDPISSSTSASATVVPAATRSAYALDLGSLTRQDPAHRPGRRRRPAVLRYRADNPFVGRPAPTRRSGRTDCATRGDSRSTSATGDLWIADVGQGDFEEVNHSTATNRLDAGKGVNFGWSAVEGYERFNQDQSADGAVAPLFVYDHSDGRCSVSGGAVARGTTVPDLAGWYVFGDYCTGQIWALDPTAPASDPAHGPDRPSSTAWQRSPRAPTGELYAVSNAGTVARIVPT